jgi:hypothetical protein
MPHPRQMDRRPDRRRPLASSIDPGIILKYRVECLMKEVGGSPRFVRKML